MEKKERDFQRNIIIHAEIFHEGTILKILWEMLSKNESFSSTA